MRILIEYVMPLFLPTLLWVLWFGRRQRHARANGHPVPGWNTVPWSWLLIAGGALALLSLVAGALDRGQKVGTYHPATVDSQGHIIPGRID